MASSNDTQYAAIATLPLTLHYEQRNSIDTGVHILQPRKHTCDNTHTWVVSESNSFGKQLCETNSWAFEQAQQKRDGYFNLVMVISLASTPP